MCLWGIIWGKNAVLYLKWDQVLFKAIKNSENNKNNIFTQWRYHICYFHCLSHWEISIFHWKHIRNWNHLHFSSSFCQIFCLTLNYHPYCCIPKHQHSWNAPQHDKTNKMCVHPAKTQISLGIRPVWSESSLCAQWVAKDPRFLPADSDGSDQTGRMPRLIWGFAGRTLILLVFSCRGSNKVAYLYTISKDYQSEPLNQQQ